MISAARGGAAAGIARHLLQHLDLDALDLGQPLPLARQQMV
jgi:hypothetical protein